MTIKRFISSFVLSMGFACVAHIIRTLTPKPFLSRFSVPYTRDPFGWFLAPPDISNPIGDPIMSEWSATLILAVFPILPVAVIELFIWSLWDVMAALGAGSNSGLIYWGVLSFAKYLFVVPSAIFASTCRPVQPIMDEMWRAQPDYVRTSRMWFGPFICDDFTVDTSFRGPRYEEIRNALSAFPSGRVGAAWLSAGFLVLYLGNKLKVFDFKAPVNAMCVTLAFSPLAVAVILTGIFVMQQDTTWTIAAWSAGLAWLCVVPGYKSVYVGLFDPRPIERHVFPPCEGEVSDTDSTNIWAIDV